MLRHAFGLILLAALTTGCSVSGCRVNDGEACDKNDDCKSDSCFDGYCQGSACSCGSDCPTTGVESSECEEGYICKFFPSGIFSGSSSRCVAKCGSCAPNEECLPNQSLCTYNPSWDDPVLKVSADITVPAGEPVTLTASATSPVGNDIVRIAWNLGDGTKVDGSTVTHTYMSDGGEAFGPTATATDSEEQTTEASVSVTICRLAGTECDTFFQSDGHCCSGQCVEQGDGTEICQ